MQEANDELRRLNFSYEQILLELKQAKQNAELPAPSISQATATSLTGLIKCVGVGT